MERYDIAIIGTGPAGISAALTGKVRNKKILLLGSKMLSEKVQKAHKIYNYPGLPETDGKAMQQAFLEQLSAMDITITQDSIKMVYAMGDYFALQGLHDNYEANTVIAAFGVTTQKPFPGEETYLGRGVSYCATCDAPLYKGKKTAIVGFSKKEEAEAAFMAETAKEVLYFPMYEGEINLPENVTVLRESIVGVEGGLKAQRLVTESAVHEVDGIFFLRENIAAGNLIPGIEMDGSHIKVNRKMETNLAGCFACGDVTGTPYQYIKAAGEGNAAVLSAVSYLSKKM